MNLPLDKRLHAFRDDVADARLKGRVDAQHFVEGQAREVVVPLASLHKHPANNAMQLTQALFGETLHVFHEADGFSFVQLQRDGYVGYVQSTCLGPVTGNATHVVTVPSTHLYPSPDLKTQPATALPMLAQLRVTGQSGDYVKTPHGFVFAAHTAPLMQTDPVAIAELFLHTPYLWGGKSRWGIDCSGLVQLSFQACAIAAPRDSDMQEQGLGVAIDAPSLRRGDLVFWKGHVGLMQDKTTLLHANGHHMQVVSEPLQQAIDRIAAKGSAVTAFKRVQ
jgi:cell wall-associated NlpC family hydrolase